MEAMAKEIEGLKCRESEAREKYKKCLRAQAELVADGEQLEEDNMRLRERIDELLKNSSSESKDTSPAIPRMESRTISMMEGGGKRKELPVDTPGDSTKLGLPRVVSGAISAMEGGSTNPGIRSIPEEGEASEVSPETVEKLREDVKMLKEKNDTLTRALATTGREGQGEADEEKNINKKADPSPFEAKARVFLELMQKKNENLEGKLEAYRQFMAAAHGGEEVFEDDNTDAEEEQKKLLAALQRESRLRRKSEANLAEAQRALEDLQQQQPPQSPKNSTNHQLAAIGEGEDEGKSQSVLSSTSVTAGIISGNPGNPGSSGTAMVGLTREVSANTEAKIAAKAEAEGAAEAAAAATGYYEAEKKAFEKAKEEEISKIRAEEKKAKEAETAACEELKQTKKELESANALVQETKKEVKALQKAADDAKSKLNKAIKTNEQLEKKAKDLEKIAAQAVPRRTRKAGGGGGTEDGGGEAEGRRGEGDSLPRLLGELREEACREGAGEEGEGEEG